MNGRMYLSMMDSYVGAINEGAVPNIENAWNYMCQQQCEKALDDCFELFVMEVKERFNGDFPTSESRFHHQTAEAKEKALDEFRQKALGDHSQEVLKELRSRINQQIDEMTQANIKESEN